jgi:glycerophosphoryl diester phosphodiesterase
VREGLEGVVGGGIGLDQLKLYDVSMLAVVVDVAGQCAIGCLNASKADDLLVLTNDEDALFEGLVHGAVIHRASHERVDVSRVVLGNNLGKAVDKALELGVDQIETDIRITKDGELIVLHDLTYDSTTNAVEYFGRENVYASELTFEEAQVLNLGENFSIDGEYPYRGLRGDDIPYNLRIAKCEDIIDFIEANSNGKKYRYIIENKGEGEDGNRAADRLYTVITERNLQDRVIWASDEQDVSKYMEETYPDISRSANVLEVFNFYVFCKMGWDLDDLDPTYVALQIPYGKSAAGGIINLGTKQVINYAHKYDIAVQYWTVNDAEDVKYLTENGADCIMTDYPQMAFEAISECK